MFRYLFLLLAGTLFLAATAPAAHAASLAISCSGDRSFIVQGKAMDGVSGIELHIAYDTASLSTPSVTLGSLTANALLAANTSKPGNIIIAILTTPRAITGGGPVVNINFASRMAIGGITTVSANLIDLDGKPVLLSGFTIDNCAAQASDGFIATPGVPFSQDSSTSV
ncbi:MAG: hypothetical protein HGB26_06525, partial [Desulfobulbaceae bacterium]|nr:hypothetical protein [Desulfobulbaceae bacterium]